jgi:hypothetical protein
MTGDNRIANALGDVAAARDALKVAEAAVGLGIGRDAMSRAYYAAFHAARALLLLEGFEARTHGGLVAMVGQHLVRTGKLDTRFNLVLTRLQAYRQASDYAYAFDMEIGDVAHEIEAARALVELAAARVAASEG